MYCRANEIRLSSIYSREGKSQGNKANESKYIVQLLAATSKKILFISLPRKDKIRLV